jgi:hypothetical protein
MASIQVDILTALRIWGYALQDQLSRGTQLRVQVLSYGEWGKLMLLLTTQSY